MNIVDTSGWLAVFADEPNADHFLEPMYAPDQLIVPVITLYEVFKVVLRESSEADALTAVAAMSGGTVIDLDTTLSIEAARLSHSLTLPMADSIILATARRHDAVIWTQDADFKDISNVKYFPA